MFLTCWPITCDTHITGLPQLGSLVFKAVHVNQLVMKDRLDRVDVK